MKSMPLISGNLQGWGWAMLTLQPDLWVGGLILIGLSFVTYMVEPDRIRYRIQIARLAYRCYGIAGGLRALLLGAP